jgi:replicative DNA helicase
MLTITTATESEKMVLGALLLDGPLYNIVKSMLCPMDFSDPARQEIYAAINDLFKKHGCFDMAMLVDEMPAMQELLYQLANECVSTANIEAHACIIREKSVQRQLVKVAQEIAEAATQ